MQFELTTYLAKKITWTDFYLLAVHFAVQLALVPVPVALVTLSILKPCIPPLMPGVVENLFNCSSWEDDGVQFGLLPKVMIGLLAAYTWSLL